MNNQEQIDRRFKFTITYLSIFVKGQFSKLFDKKGIIKEGNSESYSQEQKEVL